MAEEEELPPSKLGTKDHWDMVYERENRVFDDIGDEGEVFGEDSVDKMRTWAHENLEPSATPIRVLECGSGNGTLLLSFLTSPGPDPQAFHLTGIDYSAGAVKLGASVEKARREALEDEDELDEDDVLNPVTCEWRVGDLLRDDIAETWDLVLDKGTFDALALSQDAVAEAGNRLPSLVYPERVARLVKPGGFFLITSCNFTEEETKRRFTREGVPFTFHSSVPHKSFSFGGKVGQTVCTVAFTRNADEPSSSKPQFLAPESARSSPVPIGTPAQTGVQVLESRWVPPVAPLYLCIDCGGTKTEVVVATDDGIVSRAINGTSNMAEVGAQRSSEIIIDTVLHAVGGIGCRKPAPGHERVNPNGGLACPVGFEDIWIGISGCDTPLDQRTMSDLLSPFFGQKVEVQNDALLLGGAMLSLAVPWGVAVIAGTGSIVVALDVNKEGKVVQAARRGGHGYLLGDDGSAYDIGRCAIRAAVHTYDAGEEVSGGLADKIRAHFGVNETGELLGKVHVLDLTVDPVTATNAQKLRISSLAREVLTAFAASPPDPLAVAAVEEAIAPLATSVVRIAKQMAAKPLPDGSVRSFADAALIMGGGVIRQDAYRSVFLKVCKDAGVEFGHLAVVDDVGGKGALGLVDRAKRAHEA
ncbi:Protein-lysine N-methyltransferase efm4 [Vanrija albida]|uniref:Protein-lysine N-methyltransferase EFM4 n=1 Tax=Vanrija albida TaxID=181172 RepID=A0ABR3Q334_9TREE